MSSAMPRQLGDQFLRDAEQFVNGNLGNPEAAWPVRPAPGSCPAASTAPEANGLAVFVGGKLCLDYEVRIDMPFADWLAALQAGREKVRHSWTLTRCGIGGFPAHAARTASAKGATVALGTALPRKRPRLLQEFLDRHRLCTGSCHTYDGPMPHTLLLVFSDRTHRLLIDAGPETPPAALVPPHDCVAILLNPGGSARRQPLLSFIRRLAAEQPHTAIGIIGRDDWTPQDWNTLQGSGCHIFLNRRELEASLGTGPDTDPIHLLTRLRSLAAEYTVTATLGGEGAMILNWNSHLTHVTAAAVKARRLCGAGDTYATTALLALALGHRCGHAARLAALDAARWVSGRPPASSLAELEEEVLRCPEITERHVRFPAEAA